VRSGELALKYGPSVTAGVSLLAGVQPGTVVETCACGDDGAGCVGVANTTVGACATVGIGATDVGALAGELHAAIETAPTAIAIAKTIRRPIERMLFLPDVITDISSRFPLSFLSRLGVNSPSATSRPFRE
jgi:hypothetical protein